MRRILARLLVAMAATALVGGVATSPVVAAPATLNEFP